MKALGASELTALGVEEVLAQMPAAVMVVEARSRRIVYANAHARRMIEQQLGRPIPVALTGEWDIFHPDGRLYRLEEWPLVRSITTGEEVVDEECFHVRPDGSRLVCRCCSSPVFDKDGRIVGGVLVIRDITRERHAEAQIAYHARLADIVEDAVVGTDAEFRVTVWNQGAERLYGYRAIEVLGRDARDVATYAGDTSRIELERELMRTDRARVELTDRRKDGTLVEVELIVVAVRGELGEITGYLGIHRDMTDRKRVEEALRASHRQIETILESITETFIAVDRQWRFTYINDRALRRIQRQTGKRLTRAELLGTDMWKRIPDAVAAGLSDQLREAMKKQRPIHLESYFAPKDEWVDTYLYPSRNGLSIYIRDITERKRASQALERSASQQAAVVELGLRALASDDLQSLMDEAAAICGRMLEVELVGIHERLPGGDELVLRAGTGWSEGGLGSATSLADDASPLGHTLTSGEPLVCEDMTADGRFALSPLLAEHGATGAVCVVIEGREAPFGVLGAFATQARSFSAMDADFVQAIANVLATAVERAKFEQRLVEVREIERLRIARDLHDEALQDLSETITRAATAGSGQAEARLADVVPALQRIGRQLRGAIHDLRLAGDEDRPFPELVRGLVDVQRGLTDGCDITLTIGDGVPTGPLGRRGTEVLRIIGEAIINARRHADARHISVSVSALGRRLHAEVSDDGCGFDAQRGRAADATGIDGMGERAALLDGELHITSQAGAGTRIRIELPLTGPREPAEQVIRILLVDDHTAVREAIAAMLQREPDFDVVGQASSLAEAREMLHGVDVAVLDLGLPDGDGTELIAALRDVDPRAQALVLSAGMDRAQTARAIEGGAAATLDKTAHLHEIVDAVRRLRAGETPIALAEVLELLRFVDHQRAQERADRAAIARLTPSEREVLQALGHGLDSDAIAQRLDITSAAQRDHVASILAKLGVHSQLQAVLLAVRYGVIDVRQPGGRDGDHPDGAA